ncbi:unnamed protein product [Bemisia tabaci]|uniref:Lysosomal dipeptide transporter MFSD1 n=1 Tax=Bemisia tabaci TaxID=7038 RepID=A0A9P0AIR2_BEMTA|nr:PREDICTED: major facilitator superfamily domain-containing protein 1-like [Bemisia tabaci]CAH0392633.1 unnamed protein product [Bemisia tabaci]
MAVREPLLAAEDTEGDEISRIPSPVDDIESNGGAQNNGCCHPNGGCSRLFALVFMCVLGFGSYFCYDNPGALQDDFIDDMGLSTSEFVQLYSWYSWPNVILCFVGGFLIDRVFGIRFGTMLYAMLVCVGQLIFASGAFNNSLWIMIAGRFIFGIGGESLAVAQNNYAVLWFKGKELNLVFGFQMSFARVGSFVNFQVVEPLYHYVNKYYKGYECLGIVLFIASGTCLLSLISSAILAWMDKRAHHVNSANNQQQAEEVVRLTDIKDFPKSFWMVTFVIVTYYVAIFPFVALGKVFFERKFDLEPSQANFVNSIVYLIAGFLSPFIGLALDKTGCNVMWAFFSILGTIIGHSLLAFTFLNPYYGMVCMAVGYTTVSSTLWPIIGLIIPEYQLGTAYGIAQSVQNLGLALIAMLAGLIVDMGGYLMLECFFLFCLGLALMMIIFIWIHDYMTSGILNMTVKQREIYERNRLAAEILEHEKLLAAGSMSDITPHDLLQPHSDLLQPHSDLYIRNRFLSRIGASIPSHVMNPKGLAYRPLR